MVRVNPNSYREKLGQYESFVREYIFEPGLDIRYVGLFVTGENEATVCLEAVWSESVSEARKKEIESDTEARITEEFPELRGVEFFQAAGPVVIKIEKAEKGLIRPS